MRTPKNARLLFLLRSTGWSLVFYLLLMTLLNWSDIGKKQQVVVTSEQSQPVSTSSSLPTHTPGSNVRITEGNG